jgi:hypothetical protein
MSYWTSPWDQIRRGLERLTDSKLALFFSPLRNPTSTRRCRMIRAKADGVQC